MGTAAVQLKIMPESLDTDLKDLTERLEKALVKEGAMINKTEEQDIAFGLKALIITFAWPEEKDTSIIENATSSLEGVNSVQIIDYRRAFG